MAKPLIHIGASRPCGLCGTTGVRDEGICSSTAKLAENLDPMSVCATCHLRAAARLERRLV